MVKKTSQPFVVDFPGKDPDEGFEFSYRQHWVRLVWPCVRTFCLSFVIIFIGYIMFFAVGIQDGIARHTVFFLLLAFFLLFQWELLVRFYRHFLSVVIVTDRRIHRIKRTLLTLSDHDSIDLRQLKDVRKTQRGLIQAMFRYGSLYLEAQNATAISMHFTPHIDWCHSQLLALRERVRVNDRKLFSDAASQSKS